MSAGADQTSNQGFNLLEQGAWGGGRGAGGEGADQPSHQGSDLLGREERENPNCANSAEIGGVKFFCFVRD